MSSEQHAPSAGEYITHHLQHLQKNFAFESKVQNSIVDFSLFNLDSLVFATVLGFLGVFLLWLGVRKATSGVPGRFQAAVEILFEMVDNQAKGVIDNPKSRASPGARSPSPSASASPRSAGTAYVGCRKSAA